LKACRQLFVPRFWPSFHSCLTNAKAPPPITLESCSKAQMDQPVLKPALEKKFFGWDHRFFVSDLISVVFGPFWLMLPGLGPNR